MANNPLLTFDQAAEYLHVCRSSVYNLVGAGRLKPIHIGKSARFTQRELDRFIDSLESMGS